MIRADMIPDEVVEAAKEAYRHTDEKTMSDWLAEIIAAAINAWPDMVEQFFPNSPLRPPGVFLPLPQENRDE